MSTDVGRRASNVKRSSSIISMITISPDHLIDLSSDFPGSQR